MYHKILNVYNDIHKKGQLLVATGHIAIANRHLKANPPLKQTRKPRIQGNTVTSLPNRNLWFFMASEG
jgi:hypothetical protein